MAGNRRNLVAVATAATVLVNGASVPSADTCDWFADACVKDGVFSSMEKYPLEATNKAEADALKKAEVALQGGDRAKGAEICALLCGKHASCTSWFFFMAKCEGLDALEPPVNLYDFSADGLASARWSCDTEDIAPRVWFNEEGNSTVLVSQKGCTVTVKNANDFSDMGFEYTASLNELRNADGVLVGRTGKRDEKNKTKTIEWVTSEAYLLTGITDGPRGVAVADCPGKGWKFHVKPENSIRDWWNHKDQIQTATMTAANCTVHFGDSNYTLEAPKLALTSDLSKYYLKLFLHTAAVPAVVPQFVLSMPSWFVVYVYGPMGWLWDEDYTVQVNLDNIAKLANTPVNLVPLPMPLCEDPAHHVSETPACLIEEATQEVCEAASCTFTDPQCDCTTDTTEQQCVAATGTWEDTPCLARALATQQAYGIDPMDATQRIYNANGVVVSGINDWCTNKTVRDYLHEVAQHCCSSLVSICGGDRREGGKCVNVPGETRMRLAARGYKLSECTADQNRTATASTTAAAASTTTSAAAA